MPVFDQEGWTHTTWISRCSSETTRDLFILNITLDNLNVQSIGLMAKIYLAGIFPYIVAKNLIILILKRENTVFHVFYSLSKESAFYCTLRIPFVSLSFPRF